MERMSAFDGGAENGLMTKVDAVEVPDGQHASVPVNGIPGSPRL
jgi:hypothetical protein